MSKQLKIYFFLCYFLWISFCIIYSIVYQDYYYWLFQLIFITPMFILMYIGLALRELDNKESE